MAKKKKQASNMLEVQNAAKTLFANIRFMSPDNPIRSIVMTSSVPNEGKSTCSVELARAIATSGKTVLLVEADMRRRTLASLLNVLGANIIAMFIAFGLLYWVTMSRIIRGQILQLKQQEYVTAARALGASSGRIIRRHLLPNCIGQIVATTCLQIPSAIFTESFMSFLGVGVLAPLTSLGSMCSDALGGISTYPYRLIIPAIIISIMILSFNLFGDGLRDALDPRLKK